MRTAAMEASALDQKFIGAHARRDTPEPCHKSEFCLTLSKNKTRLKE